MDLSRARFVPDEHQVTGTRFLSNRVRALLGDTPGAGKSKQVIDAACLLYEAGEIDTVLVSCPAQVTLAWQDETFGEIAKHVFLPSTLVRLSSKTPLLPEERERLTWGIVSYEMARDPRFLRVLRDELRGRRVLVVLDESLRLANWKAEQNRAMKQVVAASGNYAWELNGTPGNPIHLYGQFEVLSPQIIGCKNYYHFEARHVEKVPIKPGSKIKKVIGFINKDLLDARLKDYVLRRCPPLTVERSTMPPLGIALPAAAWEIYKQMKTQALAELDRLPAGEVVTVASNAMAKTMRLCQITGGFVGGAEWGPLTGSVSPIDPVRWLHNAKIDAALDWLADRWAEDEEARVIIWCRFTEERHRLLDAIGGRFKTARRWGLGKGHLKKERDDAVHNFTPATRTPGPGVLAAQQQAGGLGLTLVAAHDSLYYSSTWSWFDRNQTEGRTARKTQAEDCRFWDLIATGPDGQKTIDHRVLDSVRKGADLAQWTVADWRQALED